jgi:hypothetical protein
MSGLNIRFNIRGRRTSVNAIDPGFAILVLAVPRTLRSTK